ncbi:DNA gyrase subunit B [Candidatus Wolfebacteria bacterium RIFCSPHIGHO2_01_FULL_48_22]|uniref:DNA topoisomerase (ATP-hydrolyzing) n=2 Tax=Candidatus Wolfeibacteriota TaxID=1752735 RepID=A0A1F8DTW7_9BACT|nr:MAG: DNA gyrase subunit B [Candidatus Wolfebacteria bacterium RIFCSPHIGHO2_01_FULL_48_22]OGM92232.1 MAG: DNA gyrase subunit B [Candidatus Wolfebacteria bacterium RIFCSPLOWO2_01_FULL_47_17b]
MADKKEEKKDSYSAKDIYVLEGLEPVRKRPGMYIGSTGTEGLHHLVWEVVDNSIDEAMAGYAKNIRVELLDDNVISVTDDGRGIPVDIHPKTKKSALETALCTLHAGGKFGGDSYKVSGGLHGVGVSVVNALSRHLKAEVHKDGGMYVQEYKIGAPQYNVKKIGKTDRTGTKITFQADEEIFSKIEYDRKKIIDHLRQQAFLVKGVKIEIIDARAEVPLYYAFCFEGGLLSFLSYLNEYGDKIQDTPFYVNKEYEGMPVEVAFTYNNDPETQELSFANNIYTMDGGMHLTGFRTALTRALNDFARESGAVKEKEENFTGDDVREGLVAVVSIKLREPQFEGQTKARLGNPPARTAVEAVVSEGLKEFFQKYSGDARVIINKALLAAKARKAAKAAKETVLRKGPFEGLTLPGKLADCSSKDPAESELFIVEGDSAGGCFSGDTKVALADGRHVSFKELVKEHTEGKKNYCYTIDKNGDVAIVLITNPRITKKNSEVLKVVLDNGEEIICTPDHRFMLKNGEYKQAKDLTTSDSLMPLYRQLSRLGKRITIKGYEMVFSPASHRWIFAHLLSDAHNIKSGVYKKGVNEAVHHKDFNKRNNNPDNLVRMPRMEHFFYHTTQLDKTIHREDVKEKCRIIKQSLEFRRRMSEIMSTPDMKKLLSTRAKKQWQDKDYKEYMMEKFLAFYYSHSEYREANKEALNKAQAAYWANEKNRKAQAKRVREFFESHPERKTELSKLSKKQWQDEDLRVWRREETKKQWTPEFREKRKKTYNQTYLNKALGAMHDLYEKKHAISTDAYNELRKALNDKSLIRYDTVCGRFFGGDEKKMKEAAMHFNHKIKEITTLKEKIDVYDIEVPETHNFALASGVFVHNSGKQGRDRRTQAILPLRGKILNVEKARLDKMLANNEIKSLVIALGTAIGADFLVDKIRYHKIIIMTDADVDGAHIRTLLLTLFFRHFRAIIENGYIYIAQPPLYRVQSGKEFKYAFDDEEKEKIAAEFTKAKTQGGISIQRYKGLGEMNPQQLWETTMDPATRLLKRVTIEDAQEADRLFDVLMGEKVAPRKHFIQSRASMVSNLDI